MKSGNNNENKVSERMYKRKTPKHTIENARKIAAKFNKKSELKRSYPGIYSHLRKLRMLDEIFYKGWTKRLTKPNSES